LKKFTKKKPQKYKTIWKIILKTFKLSKIEKSLFGGIFFFAILSAWLLEKKFDKNLIDGFGHQSFVELLCHNLFIQLSIILGGFTFGTLSFLILFINIFMISAIVLTLYKVVPILELLIIVPHGIFELLAFIVSFKVMATIVYFIIKKIKGEKDNFDFLCLLVRLSLMLLLLVLAAFIEINIY
jgi:uncharacterized membrane protein SpoIIM required for sporulation